jgi:hypothetical protein
MTQHVVNFSFGVASWATAKLVVAKYGPESVTLLFADTLIEDEDTYAWGEAAAKNVGAKLVRIADGRTPWELFHQEGMMGSTRADLCSRILKRELLDRWLADNCDPADTTRYIGIHWSESDRFLRFDGDELRGALPRFARDGWLLRAPLCESPLKPYEELHAWAEREGLWKQKLYRLGFQHANCGGFCVKAGHTAMVHLLKTMPERYAEHEEQERLFRERTGKDVSILRDRKGGESTPLTLEALRLRYEKTQETPLFDWGACSCFSGQD